MFTLVQSFCKAFSCIKCTKVLKHSRAIKIVDNINGNIIEQYAFKSISFDTLGKGINEILMRSQIAVILKVMIIFIPKTILSNRLHSAARS